MTPEQIAQAGTTNTQRILTRADSVIRELYGPDARIVDNPEAGVQGNIDAHDVVQYTGADGRVRYEFIGDQNYREIQMRTHMLEGAQTISAASAAGRGPGFNRNSTLSENQINTDFWEINRDPSRGWVGALRVKDGVDPSAAIDDVFQNPNKYAFDCALMSNLIGVRAVRMTLGDGDFNASHRGLMALGWNVWRNGSFGTEFAGGSGRSDEAGPPAFRPGDAGYISNPDYHRNDPSDIGENVIYVGRNERGERLFFGTNSIMTEREWIDLLNGRRDTAANLGHIPVSAFTTSRLIRWDNPAANFPRSPGTTSMNPSYWSTFARSPGAASLPGRPPSR
jgi:protein-glutamine gamma-glutamyltransferase